MVVRRYPLPVHANSSCMFCCCMAICCSIMFCWNSMLCCCMAVIEPRNCTTTEAMLAVGVLFLLASCSSGGTSSLPTVRGTNRINGGGVAGGLGVNVGGIALLGGLGVVGGLISGTVGGAGEAGASPNARSPYHLSLYRQSTRTLNVMCALLLRRALLLKRVLELVHIVIYINVHKYIYIYIYSEPVL